MYFQYNRKRKEVENISSTLSMKLYPTNFKKAISIDFWYSSNQNYSIWVSITSSSCILYCYYFATPRVDIKIPDFSLSFPLNFQISNICHLEIFVVSVFCLQVFRYAMDSNLINAYLQNKNVAQFLSNIFLVKLHNINRDMLRGLDKMDTRSILFLLMYLK